ILPQLLQHGRVVRGYLGIHVRSVPIPPTLGRRLELTQTQAVEILAVEENGPADQAGLTEEDLILSLGEQPTSSVDDLHKMLMQLPVGIPTPVILLRGERRLERWVVPDDYPERAA